ncbi:NADH:flavorubredoxin reductase NorW [Sansalvadorimonas verongulae]|uniref:NADH:flavorubredoxin reductase NorW n=1 Tax=Sansalvadorimonas verongulae TaxID=2172824 RepID=UPI0012BCDD31|nr:NADH:flavorubredoxin reductase NorW [Sansalvadorimonas verongulae]MTI12860.1 NADH:flavorubredoxin reductase NorW [Sansalvadorimonas verongulae]
MSEVNRENGIVIVGSGFAAYHLVRMLRRQSNELPITVVTGSSGDDYTKPELSHVFTKKQSADDLVKMTGVVFAQEQNIRLLAHTPVESIDPQCKEIVAGSETLAYDKLVLATGARPFVPSVEGDGAGDILTLNSLDEFRAGQEKLAFSKRVMVIGAGLVGTEIAMDLASSGREVVLTDRAEGLMSRMLPGFLTARLLQVLTGQRCKMELNNQISRIQRIAEGLEVTFNNGQLHIVDSIISAAGLIPNSKLAKEAGLNVERGICVDKSLRTSDPDIYAIGDCAEINGKVLPFLQPIMLSGGSLAKVLLGETASLTLPNIMVKVKTPLLPMQFSGQTTGDELNWKVEVNAQGMVARAFTPDEQLAGFVTTDDRMSESFPLLRQLPLMV